MLVVIALAIGSGLYIPSYQQVYSQAQPLALYVGASDSPIIEILEDEGYSVSENSVSHSPLRSSGARADASSPRRPAARARRAART